VESHQHILTSVRREGNSDQSDFLKYGSSLTMASNCRSSAAIALLFCVLLALAELHECRRAFAHALGKGGLMQNYGVNGVSNSESVNDSANIDG
jgi:hypothetical protein